MSQPSFTSWVAGYSSFLTYRTPDNVGLVFEAKFHFTTDTVNQVALLLFMGQKGTMRQGSDYLAVSYIKGHVLLTWDLGAGPRRIFTPVPVDERWGRACTDADTVSTRASNEGYPMVPEDFTITEKAPPRAFALLKAPTSAFTFKTLLRHYANWALNPR